MWSNATKKWKPMTIDIFTKSYISFKALDKPKFYLMLWRFLVMSTSFKSSRSFTKFLWAFGPPEYSVEHYIAVFLDLNSSFGLIAFEVAIRFAGWLYLFSNSTLIRLRLIYGC